MPAKVILLIIAVICAGVFFSAVVLRNLQIPALALALLVLSSVLIGAAWPAVLEQFSVRPNAIDREQTSIERNIAATRQAFNLTGVADSTAAYPPPATSPGAPSAPTSVANSQLTVSNLRIQDPSQLTRTFAGQPGLTNFYSFPDPLDIDRYTTADGQTKDYVLGVREINPSGLGGNQQDWYNRHLVYTHGNGLLYAPADRVDQPANAQSSQGGLPAFEVSDVRTPGPFGLTPEGARAYYGEFVGGPDDYAIVGGGAQGREFDGPDNPQTNYDGPGGVPVGSLAQRLVFAAAYGERNILFNGQIGPDARIMYHRTPEERVQKVAPWLRLDTDPYPAVVGDDPRTPQPEGRLQWIIDGYTTLPRYPSAQQVDLTDATTDSLRPDGAPGGGTIGYMRNSVKATVDAYTGQVTLYQVDDQDPVLKTWMNVFPGKVRPSSEVPDALRAHFRYPEDLFKVQRDLITRYHVSNARDFFSTLNFWTVPQDPNTSSEPIPPFYVLGGNPRPGAPPQAQFQITSTLLLLSRPNLAAYLSVSSDPRSYGQMTVLQLPIGNQGEPGAQGTQAQGQQGPQQVQGQLLANADVRQALLPLTQAGTQVRNGNLLTLPVAGGLLYVEPIYVERSSGGSTFPQLLGVIARFNNGNVGYDATLPGALNKAFAGVPLPAGLDIGGSTTSLPTGGGGAPQQGQPPAGGAPQVQNTAVTASVNDMNGALQRLADAQRTGDFTGIGRAQSDLAAAIRRYQSAVGGADGG